MLGKGCFSQVNEVTHSSLLSPHQHLHNATHNVSSQLPTDRIMLLQSHALHCPYQMAVKRLTLSFLPHRLEVNDTLLHQGNEWVVSFSSMEIQLSGS